MRISFSLLALWNRGRRDEAVTYFFKLRSDTNQAMADGLAWDEVVNNTVDATKSLPSEFGGLTLTNPVTQDKREVDFGDGYVLVIKPDVVEPEIVWEMKTGRRSSIRHGNSMQVPIYMLAYEMLGEPKKKGIIVHYDQYLNQTDWFVIFNNQKLMDRTRKWIKKNADEFKAFLIDQGLWEEEKN